jgi:glycosyltransferase involved in cell wall biosynthesis
MKIRRIKFIFFISCYPVHPVILIFFFLCAFASSPLFSQHIQDKTICLNMIVKDESAVIKRCLASVKPLINYWVIVDTGSTDGTQEIIREFMQDIPGELHESPWVDFAHNRNEALAFAKSKADYILFIDADEVLSFSPHYILPKLDKDFYTIMMDYAGTSYTRVGLIKSSLDWKWTGVLHESIDTHQRKTGGILQGVTNVVHTDGARAKDPERFIKDAQAMEAALEKEPNNTRYVFYIAQSYKDAKRYELAIKNYEKRIRMGGWNEEIFWSWFQIGILQEELGNTNEAVLSYLKAYEMRPHRAEPLYRLANYFRRKEDYLSGYVAAKQGLTLPVSKDILFVEDWVQDYGLLLEYSICAYWIGKYREAQVTSHLILKKQVPDNIRECVEKNLTWIDAKIPPLPFVKLSEE